MAAAMKIDNAKPTAINRLTTPHPHQVLNQSIEPIPIIANENLYLLFPESYQ
jgi:hypothetical protein